MCSEASELRAVALGLCAPSRSGVCGSFALADVGAVERAVLVQGEVPFAGGVLAVVVEPDFGAVVGLAAVDVEVFARVGHGGDPGFVSIGMARLGKRLVRSCDVPVLTAAIPERDDLREAPVSTIKLETFIGRGNVRSNGCERLRGSGPGP